jgi:trans-aconitate methyltransferase
MEYRRFAPGESVVSTAEFHHDRERAPHLEQHAHRDRLLMAQELIDNYFPRSVIDLGCGDGGLVSLLKNSEYGVWGYDFQPSNIAGWIAREVDDICALGSFIELWNVIPRADLYVLTEVLEHLEEPYEAIRRIVERGAALVCSSPWMEHEGSIDGCHNWAWDMPGYIAMLEACGMRVVRSERVTWSQVHLAVPA